MIHPSRVYAAGFFYCAASGSPGVGAAVQVGGIPTPAAARLLVCYGPVMPSE